MKIKVFNYEIPFRKGLLMCDKFGICIKTLKTREELLSTPVQAIIRLNVQK